MGPTTDEEVLYTAPKLERVKVTVKKTAEKYFNDPLHYLLYGSLAGITIGLFFNIHFPWQLYAFLMIFTGIKTFNYFKKNG